MSTALLFMARVLKILADRGQRCLPVSREPRLLPPGQSPPPVLPEFDEDGIPYL